MKKEIPHCRNGGKINTPILDHVLKTTKGKTNNTVVVQELCILPENQSSTTVFNMTGITCGAGTANPTGAPEFTPGF